MATTFLLVRHAEHHHLGKILSGRRPGVHLGPKGRDQAERLARSFRGLGVTAVQSSPRERARETAEAIAAFLRLPCTVVDALDEIDFGEWQGKPFDALARDARWDDWNRNRDTAKAPGGESMREAQERALAHLERMRAVFPEGRLVLVSHADVIKATLVHALDAPLGSVHRIEIDPASVSSLVLWAGGGKVVNLNQRMPA